MLCGTIARRARTPEAPAARRATVAVVTGVVAFAASLGLVVYRYVTPDGESADPTEASDDRETEDQTAATDDSALPQSIPIEALGVGDCFINPTVAPPPAASISQTLVTSGPTVLRVPCDEPHEREAYYEFELPAGPYPGDEQLQAQVFDLCSAQFQTYVGMSPAESTLVFSYVWPDQFYWLRGLRLGGCALHDATGLDLTGSMRGSQR